MKIKFLLAVCFCLFFPGILFAMPIGDQTAGPDAKIDYSAAAELDIPIGSVSDLPLSPKTGSLYYVNTAEDGTDCTVGGGTAKVLCMYNGSEWRSVDDLNLLRDALVELSGRPLASRDHGAFTGATIPDGMDTTQALQILETAVEVRNTSPTALNVFTADDCTLVSGMIEGDLCFEY